METNTHNDNIRSIKYNKQSDLDNYIRMLSYNAYNLIDNFHMKNDEHNKMIVAILFNKILNDFDAIRVLLERGLVDQSYALLRIMLEKRFILKAIANDSNRAKDFQEEVLYQTQGKVKKAFKLGLIDEEEKNSRLDEKRKHITASQWAEWAGLKDEYDREYSIFSDSVHMSSKLLESIIRDNEGKVAAIDTSIDLSMSRSILLTGTYFILDSIKSVERLFETKVSDRDYLYDKYNDLSAEIFVEIE